MTLLAACTTLLAVPFAGAWNSIPDQPEPAIGGYDLVAYYELGRAARGHPYFNADHQGSKWLFQSPEHQALFLSDPERYRLRYGGHCAFFLGKGRLVPGDPRVFLVRDGEVILFAHEAALKYAEKRPELCYPRADAEWSRRQQNANPRGAPTPP